MTNLNTVLQKVVKESELSTVLVSDAEIISVEPSTALLFMTLREAAELEIFTNQDDLRPLMSVNTQVTRTIVVKTSDGGQSWRLTLNSQRGSLTKEEIFVLYDEIDRTNYFWFLTHWDIAGSFPTIYYTKDFGETWQESRAIEEFLRSKGHYSVSFATGLKFNNKNDGIIIGTGEQDQVYFVQTNDGGKTWNEIDKLPDWYLSFKWNWRDQLNYYNLWTIQEDESNGIKGFSVSKSFGKFDILKCQKANSDF